MTPLRQRMIEDMQLRNFSSETQRSYIHYIAEYARHFHRSPDQLGPEAIREFQLYLTNERKMSPESVNCFTTAAKFLYQTTLELPWSNAHFVRSRVPERLPVVLSAVEVAQFFQAIGILKHRAVLMTCYGAGLRIAEAVSLKASDIDSQRMVIRVEQGKGAKDRFVTLSPRLLTVLREYWRRQRPQGHWLFPAIKQHRHLSHLNQDCGHRLAHWGQRATGSQSGCDGSSLGDPTHPLAPPAATVPGQLLTENMHGPPPIPPTLARTAEPRHSVSPRPPGLLLPAAIDLLPRPSPSMPPPNTLRNLSSLPAAGRLNPQLWPSLRYPNSITDTSSGGLVH